MRMTDGSRDAGSPRAVKRSWAMTRGFIGGALLLVAGLGFTLMVATFLQDRTIARSSQGGAPQSWSMEPSATKTQALQAR